MKEQITYKFQLDEILKSRGMTVKQLADESGVYYQTVMNIVHNRVHGVSLESISGICSALGIQPGDLFRRNEEKE
jgi:putative transcriptional regulator